MWVESVTLAVTVLSKRNVTNILIPYQYTAIGKQYTSVYLYTVRIDK